MEKYSVITTAMQQHIAKPSETYNQQGLTKEKAETLFASACEKYNCDRVIEEGNNKSAGGIGYDYRIELIEETE